MTTSAIPLRIDIVSDVVCPWCIIGFRQLQRALAQVEGIERIRYTTSHPNDMTDDLIEAHAEEPKLMPYLHLPVQSGSDRVLKAMNRRHTAESYLRLVERIRAAGGVVVGHAGLRWFKVGHA